LMNSSIETITPAGATAPVVNPIAAKVKEIMVSSATGVTVALSVLSDSNRSDNLLLKASSSSSAAITIHEECQYSYDRLYRNVFSEIDAVYYTRRVGLLSRLINQQAVRGAILYPEPSGSGVSESYFRSLCRNLARIIRDTSQDNNIQHITREKEQYITTTPKWLTELTMHYIRIVASLFQTTPATATSKKGITEDIKKIAYEEKLLATLVQVFSLPRMELGEVTASSVVQVPRFPNPSELLVGNVAQALLSFTAEDTTMQTVLYSTKGYYTLERLICGMATCQDIRVRRNISILLARACKLDEKMREKVKDLRGLQMMIELQDKL
jgi:hypothetical protein